MWSLTMKTTPWSVLNPTNLSRRGALGGLALMGSGLVIGGCAGGEGGGRRPLGGLVGGGRRAAGGADLDGKIMTFALNLEYMEAEYYTRGAYGHSLAEHGCDVGRSPGTVRGGHKVSFSDSAFQ